MNIGRVLMALCTIVVACSAIKTLAPEAIFATVVMIVVTITYK